ncbi:PhpK family radical SAM P-methyltransferase [Abyssisolibacter fermentans]|uniref:PhpK family radical SAM P-methyltransferase n=1 Tax=Abyssisolibacter fermentans TaxID=1766203 RepID=UPI00083277A3|nr:PhpK family radical SAM P-methyltransferase [Abyssisolibacter fermentans]
MYKNIDCLFIGHNEMEFEKYESTVRNMGVSSGAYRDLYFNFLQYKGRKYTASEFYNLFRAPEDTMGPLNLGESVSLAIVYLSSYLKKRGFTFDYVNSFQYEKDELIEKLKKNNIRVIAIPTTLYVSPFPILEIISLIKKYNTTAKIVVGGPFIATQVKCTKDKDVLNYLFRSLNADIYINNSQGEYGLFKVIEAIKNNLRFNQIDNIIYREGNKYIFNHHKEEDNKLKENLIDWNLFSDRIEEFAITRTSISCPFSCKFCGFPEHAGKYQTMNIQTVEQELDSIANLETVQSLQFIDDTFNVPKNRFKEILKMMIRKKYKFRWNSHFRCQFADRETIELMKESGCEGVLLGIESGSEKILANMNKKATLEKYKKGIELLREYDIMTQASYIIGFPGETDQTIQETINFIKENKTTFYRTQLWYCDTFTPIWKEREKYKIEGTQFNWSHSTMNWKEACDWIDKIFLTIRNSTWIPQYNFENRAVYSLQQRGLSIEQIKDFIDGFNMGIREKLQNPDINECSHEAISKMKMACKIKPQNCKEEILNKYQADFSI